MPVLVSAESMTATVTAYNKASLSGDVATAQVDYLQHQANPYKSRLQAGDTAVLTLSGLPQATLDSIVIRMHSNAKSGAGSLSLTIADSPVWTIADAPFSSPSWAGGFTSEYIPLSCALAAPSGDLVLTISASANSLYFESATLFYRPAEQVAYTVQMHTQTTNDRFFLLTESEPGAGILLPQWTSPYDDWLFLGWTEALYPQQTDCPVYHAPGTRYYPHASTSLYALYQHTDHIFSVPQDTAFRSGDYALVYGQFSLMANGPVSSRQLPLSHSSLTLAPDSLYHLRASFIPAQARYHLSFEGDSLYIYHPATNTFVGYQYSSPKNSSLLSARVGWQWCPAGLHTICLYHHPQAANMARMLTAESDDEVENFWLEDMQQYFSTSADDPVSVTRVPHFFLFPVDAFPDVQPEVCYSSYPVSTSLEDLSASDELSWTSPLEIFAVDGRLLFRGIISPSSLPSGLFIIRQAAIVRKFRR